MQEQMNVYLQESARDGITVTWNTVPGAYSYQVLWTDRDTPAHIYKPMSAISQTHFRFTRSMHIPYYIKVQALDRDGKLLMESEPVRTPVRHIPQPQLEELGRGLVAVCTSQGVFLSWRLLRTEVNGYTDTGLAGADFIVYKNGIAIATVTDRTSYRDEAGTDADIYAVAAVYAGTEQPACGAIRPWKQNYIDIPLRRPADGVTPAGQSFFYNANEMSVGDMDGDGEYEFIVKWDPSNAKDVSIRGYTGRCILDCYRLDGTLMWRLDMGPNIRAGAHYTQFMVYDFNGDGRAEMALKTAPGTKMTRFAPDGTILSEAFITMPAADLEAGYCHNDNYVCSADDYRDHLIQMFAGWHDHPEVKAGHWPQTLEQCFEIPVRYSYPLSREDAEELVDYFIKEWAPARSPKNRLDEFEGFIYEGPEYLTMFDGMGRELETIPYKPERGDDGLMWGDYAFYKVEPCNRVDRFLAGVAYLDGERPYLIACRGYYTRACVVAYDFFENHFREVWCVDSGYMPMGNPFNWSNHNDGTDPYYGPLAGQGNHSLSAADVDGDGCMEIVYGAATIDHDGRLLYSSFGKLPDGRIARFGHGDALHVAEIDPDRPGLEIFNVFEEAKNAPYGYALRDAETGGVYFGEYFDGDLGRCMIGDMVDGVRGLQVWINDVFDCKGNPLDVPAPSTNMRIYWAGDLTTQVTDGPDYLGEKARGAQIGRVCDLRRGVLLEPENTYTVNGTKGNPSLVADIFGDYREELLLRLADNSAIRIYTSVEDAPHKLFTLMHDAQYRCGVAWQNNCYNQPVYPSFYYASDMEFKNVLPAQEFRPVFYLVGDSTMQSFENTPEGTQGWGDALAAMANGGALCVTGHRENCSYPQERLFTLPELIIDNCAVGGRSSRTFIEEGKLDEIEKRLCYGDYLAVQFAHNDADLARLERYVAPEQFAEYLQHYTDAAADKGAQLILVTPIPSLRKKDNAAFPPEAYRTAMKEFARENNLPCLDLGAAVAASLTHMGPRRSARLYQPDGIHLTQEGAKYTAAVFAQLLRDCDDSRLSYLRAVFGRRKPGRS